MSIYVSRICVHMFARAQTVRKVSVWAGPRNFLAHAHARLSAAWPALRNGNDSLFLCDIMRVRHAAEETTLLYVRGTYERVLTHASEDTYPHCVASKKEVNHVISRVPGTLKSGFADISPSAITQKSPKTAPKYYDRSPSSDTRSIADRKRMCFGQMDDVL